MPRPVLTDGVLTGQRLLLASASPRRADLLDAAGIAFDVQAADIDERVRPGEAPEAYVRRLAVEKAIAVRAWAPQRAILAADTVVVVGDRMLGKPRDADDARRMLRLLSGRSHEVVTGVALIGPRRAPGPTSAEMAGSEGNGAIDREAPVVPAVRTAVTTVEFTALSGGEIDWYVAGGEPMDKAGAYAIQGRGSRFVVRIDGSYSNVVGLPVAVVYEMCTQAGILVS